MTVGTARATPFGADPRVRVTQWAFDRQGASTGEHQHEYEYIVVPVTGGRLLVITEDGEDEMVQSQGIPYSGSAGTRHTVISAAPGPVVFVEIELLG
jgi:beta-alanine degradation protein BauB